MEDFLKNEAKSFFNLESDSDAHQESGTKFLPKVIYMMNYVPQNPTLGEKINLLDLDIKKFESNILDEAKKAIKLYEQLETVA